MGKEVDMFYGLLFDFELESACFLSITSPGYRGVDSQRTLRVDRTLRVNCFYLRVVRVDYISRSQECTYTESSIDAQSENLRVMIFNI